MKTLSVLIFIIFCIASSSFGQDEIYLKNGKIKYGKIRKISDTTIKYKKVDDSSNGYGGYEWVDIADVWKIKYMNSRVVVYNGTIPEGHKARGAMFYDPKKHTIYGELFGGSGLLSINYMPRFFTSKKGIISFSGRIGVGMSNKSIHVPHGFILGVGNQMHQFEIGVMGVFIARLAENDIFNFLYGGGKESRYTVSPVLGYRLYTRGGFTLSASLLMIYSEDTYFLRNSGSYEYNPSTQLYEYNPPAKEPGFTPWFSIGLGYAF